MPLGLEAAVRWFLALVIVVPLAWVGARAYARVWAGRWGTASTSAKSWKPRAQPMPGQAGQAGSLLGTGWGRLRGWLQPNNPRSAHGELVVEDGVQLTPGQSVYVIRVGTQRFLIGASSQMLRLLSRLPDASTNAHSPERPGLSRRRTGGAGTNPTAGSDRPFRMSERGTESSAEETGQPLRSWRGQDGRNGAYRA